MATSDKSLKMSSTLFGFTLINNCDGVGLYGFSYFSQKSSSSYKKGLFCPY